MSKKIDSILKEILPKVSPSKEEYSNMKSLLNEFLKKINYEIKKQKISVQIFVGGSFAKNTLTKKDKYDADVFARFDKKYEEKELSNILKKIIKRIVKEKDYLVVHGSRDYFRIKMLENFYIELVPVKKVSNPKESENITDLSYLHVKYLEKKIKSQKILDEIKVAKAFANFAGCYGAESYISGFSGYSIELLVFYFGGFEKFLRGIIKAKDKEVIDIEKFYARKQDALLDLNSSKLSSPVILIDPTYKQRNALAALSKETFDRFKKYSIEFLKNPSLNFFEEKVTDLEKIKESAKKNKEEFEIFEIETEKQEGDVAGSKLLKFYKNFTEELEKFYDLNKKGFNYNGKHKARFFVSGKKKEEIIFNGPKIKNKEAYEKFKKVHKKVFEKKGEVFASEKFDKSLKEFYSIWEKKNSRKVKEMYIKSFKLVVGSI